MVLKKSHGSSSSTQSQYPDSNMTSDSGLNEANPFDFSADELADMFQPKDLEVLSSLGGLEGLERGLRTDLHAGIHRDEDFSIRHTNYGTISDVQSIASNIDRKHGSRVAIYGENRLPQKHAKSLGRLMLMALDDKVLLLLTGAAIVSLALGLYQTFSEPHGPGKPRVEWVEGVSILAAVVIAVTVGAINDWQKERQFIKLNKKRSDRLIKVTRSGKPMEIFIYDILVGDVIHLNQGDVAPVDGVLIKGYHVNCDESSLTGETRVVKKIGADKAMEQMTATSTADQLDPFIISGSTVLEGTGTYLATCVGVQSTHGRLLMSLTDETESTPLQKKLALVADQIAVAAFSVASLLFLTLLIKFISRLPASNATPSENWQSFLQIVIVSITVVVVAVPEGLPLAVTLALAIAVVRMLKDNNLVRILAACETMGNATTVCCDKTGTLTTNQMTVTSAIIGPDLRFGHAGQDEDTTNSTKSVEDFVELLSQEGKDIIAQSMILNSSAFETETESGSTFIGPRTEVALLEFSKERLGIVSINQDWINAEVVEILPFDSSRKYMTSVVKLSASRYRLLIKGAPEILLGKCTKALTGVKSSIKQAALTEETEMVFKNVINEYANHSLRTMGFAYRDFSTWPPTRSTILGFNSTEISLDDVQEDLVFIGVVGIQDPLRPGVTEAVKRCKGAGVNIKLVTGDNLGTAKAVGLDSGILTENGLFMEGSKFRKLSAPEMESVLPRLQVLARSTPEDKRILVKKLKELGQIVAVTGDGTNDGPALRSADVGFSMGLSGTEVAKEASSIVLIDDNFSSIVKAIEWGRTVNDAIRKFLQFQLTVNITSVTLTFISAISSAKEESILTPVQLLWVNLIMDTFAALALATDPPNSEVLNRKPEPQSAPLISLNMWNMIIGQSVYQLIVVLTLNFAGCRPLNFATAPYQQSTRGTVVFNTFVWMQFFNQYNNRRLDNKLNVFEGLHRNFYFIFINVVTVVGQVLIIFYGGDALSTVRLDGKQWAFSLLLGALSLPVGVFIRFIPTTFITKLLPASWNMQYNNEVHADAQNTASRVWTTDLEQQATYNNLLRNDDHQRDWRSSLQASMPRFSAFVTWLENSLG